MKIGEIILYFLVFVLINGVKAQETSCLTFEVKHGEDILESPFSGGMNAPQFNLMDVDLDGNEDLVVYERVSGILSVFLYDNGKYKFHCVPEHLFPPINSWLIIKDYNNDGIKDIFTSSISQFDSYIHVWKGTIIGGNLRFDPLVWDSALGDVLSYEYFGIEYGVYVAKIDIPAIVDLDNDGDLDILSFESGGGTINHFNNLCIEQSLPLDDFKMELKDRCWGKFRESYESEEIILSEYPDECANGSGFRHAGSTINPIDMDGDADFDLLLGDTDYPGLIYIENGGDGLNAWGTVQERDFPQDDIPIDMDWFLGSFLGDFNKDGKEELLISPNASISSKNHQNLLLYEDTSSGNEKEFKLFDADYGKDKFIDWGSNVFPVFEDYNQDGLTDLFIGVQNLLDDHTNSRSGIVLYENQGDKDAPLFVLKDDDYLGLFNSDAYFYAPAFGDLDGDEDMDLILGLSNGKLAYYENVAEKGHPFEFIKQSESYYDIDVGDNAMPRIFDADADGDLDILIGSARSVQINSSISSMILYCNSGAKEEAFFEADPENKNNNAAWVPDNFIESGFNWSSWANAAFFDSGINKMLMIGSVLGSLNLYGINEDGKLDLMIDEFGDLNLGHFSAPALSDLNNDGFFDLLVGTETGGLRLFSTNLKDESTAVADITNEKDRFIAYPNPVSERLLVSNDEIQGVMLKITLFDLMGNVIRNWTGSKERIELDLDGIEGGVYTLELRWNTSCQYIKIIKI